MPVALETAQSAPTSADRLAAENFRANLTALAAFQPSICDRLEDESLAATWIFGRDGQLTCQYESAWWGGCSIPMRTARQLLEKLELIGTLGCFLNPTHPAQIRAAFEKISPVQAILAVIPSLTALGILLHCDDFTREIGAGRLFFASGGDWPDELEAIFRKFPGLPLPQQFLRTPLLDDEEMAKLTEAAQRIISNETSRRADKMREIVARAQPPSRVGPIVVLAGSQLNLGDFSNIALSKALLEDVSDPSFIGLDPDHPLTASPLALAEATAGASALVAADVFRADLPNVVSEQIPWITWVTTGRIAAFNSNGPHDSLILADAAWRQDATKAGWSSERIQIAGWPQIVPPPARSNSPPVLGVFSDTRPIDIPQKVKDYSSQLLLWEYVEEELARNPLAMGDDADRYLDSRMSRLNIREEGFDRATFFERLLVPAYKAGLTGLLVKSGVRLALFGRGWSDFSELKEHARGPIDTIGDLSDAVAQCDAILQTLPGQRDAVALPLPFIRPAGLTADDRLRRIRHALNSTRPSARSEISPLSRDKIFACLRHVQ